MSPEPNGRSLLELAGVLTDEQAGALEEALEERRERRRAELEQVADALDSGTGENVVGDDSDGH